MKIYTVEVVCAICGGAGVAIPREAAKEWQGLPLVHRNPQVCLDNLAKIKKIKP